MTKALIKRAAWDDRFVKPSLDQLIAGMANKTLGELVEAACDAFSAIPDCAGVVTWQGVPWRWAAAYRLDGEPRPLAYVVPQPTKPLVVVPLSIEIIRSLPTRKLSKSIKDPIIYAPQVGDMLWPTWELASKSMLAEVMVIVDRKRSEPTHARSGAA